MSDLLSIQLSVFSRWMVFALQATTADEFVDREVGEVLARHPELELYRGHLVEMLAAKSADARDDHAALGAVRFEVHDTYGSSIASIVGWLVDRDPGRSIDGEVADLLDRLGSQTPIDQYPPHLSEVRLPYGRGVRLESARSTTPGPGTGVQQAPVFHTVEYRVPLDNPPASLLLVRFMTSNLAHVHALVNELEVIVTDLTLSPA